MTIFAALFMLLGLLGFLPHEVLIIVQYIKPQFFPSETGANPTDSSLP